MPTYEYLCQKCSTVYEERRPYDQADDPSRCPSCGSPRAHRQLSTVMLLGLTGGSAGGGCACSAGGTCACSAASTGA